MATERIDIVITENGSRAVVVNLNDVSRSATNSQDAVDRLTRSLKNLAVGFAANEIRKAADEYQGMENKLRALGIAQSDVKRTMAELADVANKSLQSFEGTATLYARLQPAAQALGASQKDMMTFTKAASQAMSVFGTSGGTATGAMLQLSQAMSRGKVQAQEFRSLMDGMYPLLQVVANNLDAAGGSVATLRELMLQGKLTSKEFFEAAVKGAPELELAMLKVAPTTEQAMTVLRNQFVMAVGKINEATKATETFAKIVGVIAPLLIPMISGIIALSAAYVAHAIATFDVAAAYTALTVSTDTASGALVRFRAALLANPLTAFLTAVAAVVSYLYLMRNEISFGNDKLVKMTDFFTALGNVGEKVLAKLNLGFGGLGGVLSKIELPTFEDFIAQLGANVDFGINLFKMFGQAIYSTFQYLPDVLENIFDRVLNKLRALVDSAGALMVKAANKAAELAHSDTRFSYEGIGQKPVGGMSPDAYKNIIGAETAGAESTVGRDAAATLAAETRKIAVRRQATEALEAEIAANDKLNESRKTPPAFVDPKTVKEAEKFEKLLDKLRDKYDGVYKAQSALSEAERVFGEARKKGLMNQETYNRLMKQAAAELWDLGHPLEAVNNELDRQIALSKLSTDEQEISNKVRQLTNDLLRTGTLLDSAGAKALEEKIRREREATEVGKARNKILEDTLGRERDLATQRSAINDLEKGSPQEKLAAEQSFSEKYKDLMYDRNTIQLADLAKTKTEIESHRVRTVEGEKNYSLAMKGVKKKELDIRLGQYSEAFGGIALLMQSHNRRLFAIGKAGAIAQTMIQTYQGATTAFASMSQMGPVGVVLGAVAAAAAIAAGLANVAQIRAQQMPAFAHGGQMEVGGVGGTDSQTVAFRATPGETVRVTTPSQESDAARRGGGNGDTFVFNMPGVQKERDVREATATMVAQVAQVAARAGRYS